MKMRKIIAVLSAVLMLCAIIPMSAVSVSADGSFDFEGGTVSGWNSGCTIEVVEDNGSKVLKWDASGADWANVYYYGSSMVAANTDYTVSLRVKADRSTNMNFKVNNNWAGDTATNTFSVTTEWQEVSFVINSGACTSGALLLFSSNTTAANGATYYLDDISFVEYVEPVEAGTVINGSFEEGTTGWDTNSAASIVTDDAQDGTQSLKMSNPSAWGSVATQVIPVEANASYEITWYSKRLSGTGAFNLIACQAVSPWTNYTKVAGQNWMNETSGEWVANTYTVSVGDNTSMLLKFTSETSSAGEILIDNIVVTQLKDPSDDGFIKNGDFETGKASPWTLYNTTIDADAAKSGDYGLHVKYASGGWGGTAYQDFTVEVGKTYVVMLDAMAVTKGQNIQIQNPIGTNVASKWFTGTSWTTLSYEFTATTTDARINICGGGTGVSEEIYVDNVFVFEKKAASNDGYIVNGDFETGTTEGLSPSSQTCISRDAAKDGNFGLYMINSAGDWGGVGLWTINGLEVGATYKLAMDMKAVSKGFNWTLWQDSTSSGVKYGSGYFSTAAWTTVEKEFVAASATAVLNINGGNTGVSEEVYLDNLGITLVKCAECDEAGCVDSTCSVCGSAIAGAHTYTDNCDADCDVCGEWRDAPHNLTTKVEAVEPANCQEEGNPEYWICADCGGCFQDNGWGGYSEVNPAWLYYTGDHVRPEDAIACAVVPCELCGEDTYGEACDRGETPVCQDATCVNCGETVWGWGCNYNTGDEETPLPLCQAGTCVYCGTEYEYLYECENGAWAPCQDGECSYGCGKQYPATANHTLEDCTVDGNCSVCWSYIPAGEHTYTSEYDVNCDVCGAIREIAAPVVENGFSVSEDVSGLAVRFNATVEGMGINGTTAIYDNATLDGYKVISMGAIATNGVSTIDIPVVYLCDDDVSTGAQYAIRIKNIPADKGDVEITFTPYVIVEIDGEQVTIYGDAQIGTYNQYAG